MTKREAAVVLATLTAASLLLAACGNTGGDTGRDDEFDYYGSMREIPALAEMTDAELDSIADEACGLVGSSQDAGETNERALDRVFWAMQDGGLNDADALLAALTIVGGNCPIDIRE